MRPTFASGDWVWVRPAEEARPGDVALLEASGWLEIHRLLVRIRAGDRAWYVHAGDASDCCGVVCAREILGLVGGRTRRPRPAPAAHLLGLALRLGAIFWRLGLYPGRRAARRLAGAIRPAAVLGRILSFCCAGS